MNKKFLQYAYDASRALDALVAASKSRRELLFYAAFFVRLIFWNMVVLTFPLCTVAHAYLEDTSY